MRITRHPLLPATGGLRAIPADETIIERLESSFAAAAQDGTLASRFFRRLVEADPALARLFPDDVGARARTLTVSLAAIVAALRQPEGLCTGPGAQRGLDPARGVDPLGDATVSRHLVAALAEALGDRWSAELEREWTRTFEIVGSLRSGSGRAHSQRS